METRWVQGGAGRLEVKHLAANRASTRLSGGGVGAGKGGLDVLLVHGAWSSSWYWEAHFMPFLAAQGFGVTALNLRAHGGSEGNFRWASLADYISDVRHVAETLDNPVIIGHSLGGFITQHYVNRYGARAAALLASVPHFGLWSALPRVVIGYPGALFRTLGSLNLRGVVAHTGDARSLLYARGPTQADKDPFLPALQDESIRILLDLLIQPVSKPWPAALPKLVLGGSQDRLFPPAAVTATARFHGTVAHMIPTASHMLMDDDPWQDAAERLSDWLRSL